MKSKKIIITAVVFAYSLIGIKNMIAQDHEVILLSHKVGETIDSNEKARYRLFPFYRNEDFKSAQFLKMPDSSIVLQTVLEDGRIENRTFTKEHFTMTKKIVESNVTKKNFKTVTEKETRSHRIFGIGLRVNQLWYNEVFQIRPPSSTITIAITPHKNFRIEPEIGYFSSKSHDEQLKEDLTDKSYHIGLGIYPILQKGNTNLYLGIRLAEIRFTDEFAKFIPPTRPPGNGTFIKEELISKQYLIGPVLGAEYLFTKHFSFGGEMGLKYSIIHNDVDNSDSTHNHDEDKTKSYLTESNLFVRFYF
ncbi:MAG: hypothetical protein JKY52_14920 [Flavobacteriales bacterium]|nr:hypothetical protein [Flavobacteriales bacterium]